MNHFSAYAKKARTIASRHPTPLIGPTRTRREAMLRYQEIVVELHACEDEDALEAYLTTLRSDIAQFRAELDFLWNGDGEDFVGLSGEIAAAKQRILEFQASPGSEAERIFDHM